ncbi:hypothetical protein ACR2XN_28635, partial [Klebsiella pneumoniae]
AIVDRSIQENQGNMVNTSCALIVNESAKSLEAATGQLRIEEVCEDEAEGEEEDKAGEDAEDEFYSLEELDGMKNSSYAFMARKFPNLRFKKNQPFRAKPKKSFFNKGKGSILLSSLTQKNSSLSGIC